MCCENTCPPHLLSLLREQRWQNTTGGVTLDVSQAPTAGGLTQPDRSSHVFQIKPPRQVVQCHVVNLITQSSCVMNWWQNKISKINLFVRPGVKFNYVGNTDICVQHQYCHICTNIYLSVTLILMSIRSMRGEYCTLDPLRSCGEGEPCGHSSCSCWCC